MWLSCSHSRVFAIAIDAFLLCYVILKLTPLQHVFGMSPTVFLTFSAYVASCTYSYPTGTGPRGSSPWGPFTSGAGTAGEAAPLTNPVVKQWPTIHSHPTMWLRAMHAAPASRWLVSYPSAGLAMAWLGISSPAGAPALTLPRLNPSGALSSEEASIRSLSDNALQVYMH